MAHGITYYIKKWNLEQTLQQLQQAKAAKIGATGQLWVHFHGQEKLVPIEQILKHLDNLSTPETKAAIQAGCKTVERLITEFQTLPCKPTALKRLGQFLRIPCEEWLLRITELYRF